MDWTTVQVQLSSTDSDKRLHALQQLQQLLAEATEISEAEELTALLKASLHASNAHLSYAALACLPAYFPLLVPTHSASADLSRALSSSTNASSPQRPVSPASSSATSHTSHAAHTLKHAFISLLPLDKLGDSKEKVRDTAREALVSAARTALRLGVNAGTGGSNKEGPWGYLETKVAEQGFHGKSAKARAQALHYLVAIRDPTHTSPLAPLRPFTPLLLPLLGDSDPTVRSLALSTTITIFSAPGVTQPARADLKKAMIKLDVNKKVQDTILAAVLGGGSMERAGSAASLASGSDKAAGGIQGSTNAETTASQNSTSSPPLARARPPILSPASLVASLPAAAFPTDPAAVHVPTTDVQAVYIADARDLQTEFERMRAGFEGKEMEHNWMVRDRSVARIRGIVKGKVQERLLEPFLVGLKGAQDGIVKTASSLRTTLAISSLNLISELSISLDHAFDPFLDFFVTHLLGMAGQTKKIVASASQATVATLITHSSYHHRVLHLLRQGMDEKTPSARGFVSSHVGTFLKVHGRASKSAIEATGGVEDIEQSVRKGLTDPNALVKENSRANFWALQGIWPKTAERILGALDGATRKALEKSDPSKKGAVAAGAGEKGPAKATRPSVRELMMLAKRQAATGTDPGPSPSAEALPDATVPSPAPVVKSPPSSRPTSMYGKVPTPRGVVSPATRSISSPSTPTTSRPRPVPSSTPGSARRVSQTPTHATPSTSFASPAPAAPSSHDDEGSESLLNFSSPFARPEGGTSSHALSASGSAPSSPSSSHAARARIDSLVLPVTEPIVDDALRDQAFQAEQAAERLLELAEEEEEEAAAAAVAAGRPTAGEMLGQMQTPVARKLRLLSEGERDVFKDSPDGRNGDGGSKGRRNWWMKKVEDLPSAAPLPPDTLERKQEIATLISSLQSGQIDSVGLKQLSALLKERPARDEDGGLSSPLASPTHPRNGSAEGEAQPFWDEERRFSKVWEGLSALLVREPTQEKKDAALLLFKDLVENQAPCFAGDEAAVFTLLFHLREDPSRSCIAAVEGIADSFVSQSEPLFSLGSLCTALIAYLAPHSEGQPLPEVSVKSFALGLRLLGKFFERLPSEVLEDEMPRRQDLIKRGLNDAHSGDLRRAAVNALVSAQSVLRDEQRLYSMVGGLGKDQLNLLSYYISKLPPA